MFAATKAAANSSASKRGRGRACSRAFVIQQTAPSGYSVRVLVDRHDLGVGRVRVDEPVASAGTPVVKIEAKFRCGGKADFAQQITIEPDPDAMVFGPSFFATR